MTRSFCWACALIGTLVVLALVATLSGSGVPTVEAKSKIRVLVWSERTEPADIYPNGINGAIADMLSQEKDITAKAVNLSDPGQGLTEEALQNTDVLLWFGHKKHGEVSKETIARVVKHIQERGLGYLPLHSAHYAKPFQEAVTLIAQGRGQKLEGTPGSWTGKVVAKGDPETIHVLTPGHPIAKGIKDFVVPHTEFYPEPFNVPAADVKIFEGHYEGGQQNGSDGLLWQLGKGKVFYFRPGHETYPIFQQPEVQHILRNAVRYLASPKPVVPAT